jgi:hypothetical protein
VRLTKQQIELVYSILKDTKYTKIKDVCVEIFNRIGLDISTRSLGDINRGFSYKQNNYIYPINIMLTKSGQDLNNVKCDFCGNDAFARYNNIPYCKRHYMNKYRNQEMQTESIFDKNSFKHNDDNSTTIYLKNKDFEIIAETIIDTDDFERVSKHKWYAHNYQENNKIYCQGTLKDGMKIRLHHFILEISNISIENNVVDHINGNSLDNRKCNLRVISQKENMRNMKPNKKLKGIKEWKLSNGSSRYAARITVDYKTINLGTFDNLNDAIQARKDGEGKYWS